MYIMANITDFRDKFNNGKRGEYCMSQFLKQIHTNIIEFKWIPKEQQKYGDISLKINNKGKLNTIKYEIKTDVYTNSPNLFLEHISNTEKNTLGCFLATEANFVLYYFINRGEIFILPMTETLNSMKLY